MVAALFVMAGCADDEPAVQRPAQRFPSSRAQNATTEFLTGSVVTTRIRSGEIVNFAERDSAWTYDLTVDFFDSTGQHTSRLVADSALVRELRRRLDGFGGVKVETDQGTTLASEHLAWNDSSGTITTDSFVVITRGDDVMSGYGFQSDPDLTRIILRRRVSGRLTDPEALEETPD